MDKDRIAGSAKDFAGKVEGTVGDIAGDAKTQAAGRVREATGTAQNLYGQATDVAREATDAAVNYAKDAYENSGDTFRDGSQAIAKKVQDLSLIHIYIAACPKRANNGSRQFSITSFAWGEQFAGTLRQIALRNQYMHADEIKIVNIST